MKGGTEPSPGAPSLQQDIWGVRPGPSGGGALEGTWSLDGWDRKPTRSQPGCVSAETRQSQAFLSSISSLLLVCNCPDPGVWEEVRLRWPDRLGDTLDSGHTCAGVRGTPAIPYSSRFVCRNSACLGAEPRGALPQPPGTPLAPLTALPRVPRPALPRTDAGPPVTRWLAQRMRLWLWLPPRGLCGGECWCPPEHRPQCLSTNLPLWDWPLLTMVMDKCPASRTGAGSLYMCPHQWPSDAG